jgi:hypothetical protein
MWPMNRTARWQALLLIVACVGACRSEGPAPAASSKSTQTPLSCSAELGAQAASVLVQQCAQVSPATHPPCNAENSCEMIRSEIKRGCEYIGAGGQPSYCKE